MAFIISNGHKMGATLNHIMPTKVAHSLGITFGVDFQINVNLLSIIKLAHCLSMAFMLLELRIDFVVDVG